MTTTLKMYFIDEASWIQLLSGFRYPFVMGVEGASTRLQQVFQSQKGPELRSSFTARSDHHGFMATNSPEEWLHVFLLGRGQPFLILSFELLFRARLASCICSITRCRAF